LEVTTAERYASGGPGKKPESSNVYEAFLKTVDRLGGDVALRTEDDSVSLTWNELSAWVSRIAGGLDSLGLKKGETVALMLNNRPEFIPCDLAAVSLGGVPFSIYQTSSPEQIAYVVSDAGSRIAIIESAFLENFSEAQKSLPDIEHVIVIDGEGGTTTLEELEAANPGFDPGL
jgi:long-subunit acyl-CoA synthetase (AMP-forming)